MGLHGESLASPAGVGTQVSWGAACPLRGWLSLTTRQLCLLALKPAAVVEGLRGASYKEAVLRSSFSNPQCQPAPRCSTTGSIQPPSLP